METVEARYREKCFTPSDIYEHLPVLSEYASRGQTATEFGMRSVVSTWALLHGLLKGKNKRIRGKNGEENKENEDTSGEELRLISVDLNYSHAIEEVRPLCKQLGVNFSFVLADDTKIEIPQTDLLFIDTWHIYGHLKRELEVHHNKVNKYIILHDTTVDALYGETIRNGWNPHQQSIESGYPVEEIIKGLWPAVEEFLVAHPEWKLEKRYTNNNGLTILSR